MKFSCEKYLLQAACSIASRAAASKSPIPALEGLQISCEDKLTIKGYDLKKAIVTSVEGRGDAGQLAIDYRGLPAVYTASKSVFTHLVTDGHYWLCEKVAIK